VAEERVPQRHRGTEKPGRTGPEFYAKTPRREVMGIKGRGMRV